MSGPDWTRPFPLRRAAMGRAAPGAAAGGRGRTGDRFPPPAKVSAAGEAVGFSRLFSGWLRRRDPFVDRRRRALRRRDRRRRARRAFSSTAGFQLLSAPLYVCMYLYIYIYIYSYIYLFLLLNRRFSIAVRIFIYIHIYTYLYLLIHLLVFSPQLQVFDRCARPCLSRPAGKARAGGVETRPDGAPPKRPEK